MSGVLRVALAVTGLLLIAAAFVGDAHNDGIVTVFCGISGIGFFCIGAARREEM